MLFKTTPTVPYYVFDALNCNVPTQLLFSFTKKKIQFVAIKEAFLSKESNTEVDVGWLYWGLTPL